MCKVVGAFALVMIFAVAAVFPAGSQDQSADGVQLVEISAERFRFTPSEIRTKAGRRLELRLRSEDTLHGFHIVGTDINVDVPKRGRGTVSVTFVPKAGRYTFECSNICGAGHDFMRGVIIATE